MRCKSCDAEFARRRQWQQFCDPTCKELWRKREHARQSEHLSITAAAAELGISRHAVYRAIRAGRLQAVQVPTAGRPRLEVTRGELERYQVGRPLRQRRLGPEEVDAEIRRAVAEMARKVQDVARRCVR